MRPKMRRMIKVLREREDASTEKDYSVYILRCCDGSFYTGIAKDVEARFEQHSKGKGAAYTRSRRPLELLHTETGFTRGEALSREAKIKALPRAKKQELFS